MGGLDICIEFTPDSIWGFRSERSSRQSPVEKRTMQMLAAYVATNVVDSEDGTVSPGRIVGESRALGQVIEQVDAVAVTDATVLITGESGTGKELLAREIHTRGSRSRRPFVKVNCSAVPRELFESEFFGHARGAFTGAASDRPGRFQAAHGGTIFLDEIGDLPVEMQP